MIIKLFKSGERYVFDLRGYLLYTLFKWSVNHDGYLYRKQEGKNKMFHRHLLEAGEKDVIDHVNRDVRDNRPCNLRFANKSLNAINCGPRSDRKYKGVKRRKCEDGSFRFQARVKIDGRNITLGTFASETDAARAYNEAVIAHFGQDVWLNPV